MTKWWGKWLLYFLDAPTIEAVQLVACNAMRLVL